MIPESFLDARFQIGESDYHLVSNRFVFVWCHLLYFFIEFFLFVWVFSKTVQLTYCRRRGLK